MKTKLAALTAVTLAGLISASTMASANIGNYYDPAEGEVILAPVPTGPVVQSDASAYDLARSFYDPAESEVVTIRVGNTPAPAVILPHNNGIPLKH